MGVRPNAMIWKPPTQDPHSEFLDQHIYVEQRNGHGRFNLRGHTMHRIIAQFE